MLWIPRPPDNANARQHWAEANRIKRAFVEQLDLRLQTKLLPPPPDAPLARASLGSTWFVNGRDRSIDDDNATRRLKPVQDWLVRRGYIVDDNKKCLSTLQPQEVRGPVEAGAPPLTSVKLILTALT